MKKFILIQGIILLANCSSSNTEKSSVVKENAGIENNKPYIELVKAALENPDSVNYTQIRMSYIETNQYNPYRAPEVIEEMGKLLKENKNEDVIKLTKKNILECFAEMDFHYYSLAAYKNLKNENAYNWHRHVLTKLIDSIFSSGDGTSTKKALVVIAVREEYTFMALVGVEYKSQHLISENGHSYDMFDTKKTQEFNSNRIYFNIDIPMSGLARMFKK